MCIVLPASVEVRGVLKCDHGSFWMQSFLLSRVTDKMALFLIWDQVLRPELITPATWGFCGLVLPLVSDQVKVHACL